MYFVEYEVQLNSVTCVRFGDFLEVIFSVHIVYKVVRMCTYSPNLQALVPNLILLIPLSSCNLLLSLIDCVRGELGK
jgi:hypothetical protein